MAVPVNFREAAISKIALAKVGNPLKGEPLLTSKKLCRFENDEADLLTSSFLVPFKSLEPYRLETQKTLRALWVITLDQFSQMNLNY